MEEKKKRGNNYTVAEKELLLDLVKKHQNIIENKDVSASMVLKKRKAWESICQQYNSVAVSGLRMWKQLRHLYENIKQRSKKSIANVDRLQLNEQSKEETEVEVSPDIHDMPINDTLRIDDQDAEMNHQFHFISMAENSSPCRATSNLTEQMKPKFKEVNIKEQYFKVKLQNAKLENKYWVNKNKMEINKYKKEMEILKLKLKMLQSSNNNK